MTVLPSSAPLCTAKAISPSVTHSSCRANVSARAVKTAEKTCETLCEQLQATTQCFAGQTALGRGLVMRNAVDKLQSVVSVPIKNALIIADDPLTSISIFSDRHHRGWQEQWGSLPDILLEFLQNGDPRWDVRMAAWLLWVKQQALPGGMWAKYMQLLPREPHTTCLLNYSLGERSHLQLPSLQAEAAVQHDWCCHLHSEYLSTTGGDLQALGLTSSLRRSLWALSMVRSRTFAEGVGGENITLMVPFADLANHSFEHNSTFCLARDGASFELRSLRPLAAGEEVTISYGSCKPNSELMRDYGFVVPGNPHDRVCFDAAAAGSAVGAGAAGTTAAAGAAAGGGGGAAAAAGAQGVPQLNPVSVLQAARFEGDLVSGDIQATAAALAAGEAETLEWARRRSALLSLPIKAPPKAACGKGAGASSSSSSGGGLFGWLDAATQPWTEASQAPPEPLKPHQVAAERASVHVLQQQVAAQLARLPTTIATDEELLRSPDASIAAAAASSGSTARVLAAVQARLEHKLVLQAAADVLAEYALYLNTV